MSKPSGVSRDLCDDRLHRTCDFCYRLTSCQLIYIERILQLFTLYTNYFSCKNMKCIFLFLHYPQTLTLTSNSCSCNNLPRTDHVTSIIAGLRGSSLRFPPILTTKPGDPRQESLCSISRAKEIEDHNMDTNVRQGKKGLITWAHYRGLWSVVS